ncbi:MAG: hypothetical protein HUU35_03365, partial [Armatimonadetes bacterium]|nr:hypothetical protein [Armatimonadota bacterium]
ALLAAALLAAMMSSAATCLLSSATIFVVDLLGAPAEAAQTVRRTRLAAAVIALLATGLALRAREIIPLLLFAYSIYSAGVVAPAMLGFWRRELRLSANGAVAAMVLGGGVALALQLAERPGPWGLVVAVVVLLSWRERPQESLSAGAAKP